MSDPSGALFLIGGTVCLLGGMYAACYTIFIRNWEGWESWNARTGLDGDRAAEERAKREAQRPR